MEEATVRPSVFVVEGQSDIPFTRLDRGWRRRPWCASRLGLGLLLLLLGTGLAVEGWFLVPDALAPGEMGARLPSGGLTKPIQQHISQGQLQPDAQRGPLLWQTQLGLAFLRGLSYRNGALVVSRAGYYIYSKVQLGGVGCPQGLAGSLPVTHGLYKRTARYPKELELLVSRQSPCGRTASSHVWWDSSFLGGLVHLEAGEEVVVRVPDDRLVRLRDGTGSYFGTFMV